jgi:N-acetylneuraminic acid mutarotase
MSGIDPEIRRAQGQSARRGARARGRAGRRIAALGVFLATVAAVAIVVVTTLHLHPFGTTPRKHVATGPTGPTSTPPPAPHSPGLATTSVGVLSAPLSRLAAVPYGTGGALLLGGFDANGGPTDAIQNFQASVTSAGTLPAPTGSAVAAVLGGDVYLFGGESSTIYQLSGTSFEIAGNLPAATADAAVATVGDTAYVIGGYSGTTELNTIVAFTPGAPPQTVATLPVTLRYATAAARGGLVYIIGGETAGVPADTVYRFDPATKAVTSFTRLPHARDRETAATLHGRIYVIGGESAAGTRSRAIYSINPSTGTVGLAGILPVALADAAAVTGGGAIMVAGGTGSSGAPVASIYQIKRASS